METPLKHLGVVEELARNGAVFSEFRIHLIAIQETLEAHTKLVPEHEAFKVAAAKEIAELKAENKELILRNLELKSRTKPDESDSNWPSPGLIYH
jgi:hypothetical protein